VVTQFRLKRCQQRAAALTYMTLFAIVPMMTVTYAMFSLIPSMQGVGEQLQGFLLVDQPL
jgi:membrane protein